MSIAEWPDQHEQGHLPWRFDNYSTNILPINAAESTERFADYDSAIARNDASFTQLAEATFYSVEKFNLSAPLRSRYAKYIGPLTKAFEAKHGHIVHAFYCQHVLAAAVLTDRNELYKVSPASNASTPPIADLLFECDRLNVEADRILRRAESSGDLRATKMLIYEVVAKLLGLVDDQVQPVSRELLDLHRREITHANDYYVRAAERYAKFDYFLGMLFGIIVCLGLIAVGAKNWWPFGFAPDVGKAVVGCLAAGGIGAVVSVMSRMTFGELSLDYEAGRCLLTLFGVFRPMIGMAFGAVMLVLCGSGILPLSPMSDVYNNMPKELFFYIFISFAAGFSERWAQDMLGRAASQIGSQDETRRSNKQTNNRHQSLIPRARR